MTSSNQLIGEILIQRGVISSTVFATSLAEQPASGQRFCSLLYLKERATEESLLEALATQQGVPGVALTRSIVDLAVLELIPRAVAERYSILALCRSENNLLVAMADPHNRSILDEVQFVTGTQVTAFLGLKGMIDAGLQSAYGAFESGRRDLLHGPQADPSCSTGYAAEVQPKEGPVDDDIGKVSFDEVETVAYPSLAAQSIGTSVPDPLATPEPVPEAETADDPGQSTPSSAQAKARILVVDDEEDIRKLLKTALEKSGYEVILAERGLEGLQAVKTQRPDLVLLDAMLPEIHGFEICQKIKSSRSFKTLPVIIVTAIYRGWRFAMDVKATYGADDYVEKPFSIEDILRRIEDQLVSTAKLAAFEPPNQDEIEDLRKRGHTAHKSGDHERALETFRLAVELDPFDAKLHFMLAMSLQSIGQTYSAIYEFERSVELQPDLYPAVKNLAVLYERKGFRNKATEMWERALRLSPDPDTKESVRAHLLKLLS